MESHSKFLAIILLAGLTVACDNGGTSSGSGSETPAPVAPPPPPVPGQSAVDCLANVQVRRNGTALVQNICGFPINVRQTNSRFDTPSPVTLIAPGQLVAVRLGDDSLTVGFGACRAPSIPQASTPGFFTCSSVPAQGKRAEGSFLNEFPVIFISQ